MARQAMNSIDRSPILIVRLERAASTLRIHSLGLDAVFEMRRWAAPLPIALLALATKRWLRTRDPLARRTPWLRGALARRLYDALRKDTGYLKQPFPKPHLRLQVEGAQGAPPIFYYEPRDARSDKGYALRVNWPHVTVRVEIDDGCGAWRRVDDGDGLTSLLVELIEQGGELVEIELDGVASLRDWYTAKLAFEERVRSLGEVLSPETCAVDVAQQVVAVWREGCSTCGGGVAAANRMLSLLCLARPDQTESMRALLSAALGVRLAECTAEVSALADAYFCLRGDLTEKTGFW